MPLVGTNEGGSPGGQPPSERYLSIQGSIALLAYRVSAERSGDPICEALCTSTYLKDGGTWLRLTHQRTPAG